MKSILISIKPRHCVNILNGDKKIEVRTTTTKEWKDYLSGKTDVMPEPIECLIYCTKQTAKYYIKNKIYNSMINGKVVAKFTLNKVENIFYNDYYELFMSSYLDDDELCKKSCVSQKDMADYFGTNGGNCGYAWHIDNLVIFDKPMELSEFRHSVWLRNEYIFPNPICDMCKFPNCKKCERHYGLVPLIKAPQSWCYVAKNEINN